VPHTGQHIASIDAVYRAESRRVLATLIRLLGDFELAEEAMAEAFRAAIEQWPAAGVPANPRAWLVSTGRFRAIDSIRRNTRFVSQELVAEQVRRSRTPGPPVPTGRSRTTACVWCSPAATRRCPPTRRWR
jgi:RNA polymerase sigma-70 factor (ECF subfamily)